MAKSITTVKQGTDGSMKYHIFDLDITSYTASGEPLSAMEMGFNVIDHVKAATTENGYVFLYDYTNAKMLVKMFDNNAVADGAMMAFTTGGDAGTCRVMAVGI